MNQAGNLKRISFPASARHWWLVAAAWAFFIVSLFTPLALANFFVRFYGGFNGLTFHYWLFFELPPWIVYNSRGVRVGYVSPLDYIWYISAILSAAFFLLSPVIMLICRRATSLTIVRCLSLILLTFPITLFLPAKLNFPQPFFGMYFLAAAHLLTLVAFWLPRVRENAPLAGDLGFAVVLDKSAK